jgi:hypothetical protein
VGHQTMETLNLFNGLSKVTALKNSGCDLVN